MSGHIFAQLDEQKLHKLRELEQETGSCLVALSPDVQETAVTEEQLARFKRMNRQQLAQLKTAESELGVILLAYQQKPATAPGRPAPTPPRPRA